MEDKEEAEKRDEVQQEDDAEQREDVEQRIEDAGNKDFEDGEAVQTDVTSQVKEEVFLRTMRFCFIWAFLAASCFMCCFNM